MKQEYDFKRYRNVEDVTKYSVFVHPDGSTFKVWCFDHYPYSDEMYVTHTEWADAYVESNEEIKKEYDKYCEIQKIPAIIYITSILHYIGYSRIPEQDNNEIGQFNIFPYLSKNSTLFNYKCSSEQINTIKTLQQINHDTPSKEFIEHIFECMPSPEVMIDLFEDINIDEFNKRRK